MAGTPEPTFADWYAIHTLLVTYAERVDSGRFDEAAAMFGHATYRVEHVADGASVFEVHAGIDEVHEYMSRTRRYEDGTPRTRHVNTNVNIAVDGDSATSRNYVTVFQATPTLPLQPVASGCYVDRFERVAGEWRFTDRLITGFLVGDVSQHKDPPR
jgi:3-phenylpropionate/cinnamic acid dioxygenase small subunit